MKIIITGGASGLGAAITRQLALDTNNEVHFTFSNSATQAAAITSELKNTAAIKCDFKNAEDIASLTHFIKAFAPDVLINNAYTGSFLDTYFHKTDPGAFAENFQQNIVPTITITQAAILAFRKKKSGKIITILTAALAGTPPIGSSVYVAQKAYLQKLTQVWATENGKFNITSNTISPSFMETQLTSNTDERMLEQIKEGHPLKTLLKVEEVAEAVNYLVHASAHVNGIDLLINAGSTIR